VNGSKVVKAAKLELRQDDSFVLRTNGYA
jgi:hypothetical protein